MNQEILGRIEKTNLWVLGILLVLSSFYQSLGITLSILVGGIVMTINFYILKGIIKSILFSQKPALKRFTYKITLKSLFLYGLVGVTIFYFGIRIIPFSLGISTLVFAIFFVGIKELIKNGTRV